MKRIKIAFTALAPFLLLAVWWPQIPDMARAQIATPAPGMIPLGYCQLGTLSSSTGLGSCSGGIPAGSNAVIMRAEAQALRYRADGATTAPTATVGMPMLVADPPIYYRAGQLANLRFIEQTSGGKLNVTFYQAP